MPIDSEEWYKLDNAAKIIPSTTQGSDTRVFRITCELKERVDPEILQRALDISVKEFPFFNCCMKKGLFWYYLEPAGEKAAVQEESLPALSPLYVSGRRNLLYRVVYYNRRISLEMYHVLSDGTGAFFFLKLIVENYLAEKYHLPQSAVDPGDASLQERARDAFNQFYQSKRSLKKNPLKNAMGGRRNAYQLKGTKDADLAIHIQEGTVSVRKFLELCGERHTTLTVMTTAIYIEAIIRTMKQRDYKKPISVTVPVNLRNYFTSDTARNFYGVINVSYDPRNYDGRLENIIEAVSASFARQLQRDNILTTMNTYSALEQNWAVRIIPLQLKDIGIQGINFLRSREVTTSVSNVGIVRMPAEMEPYIDRFSSFMSTNKTQMCISSFADQLAFGFTSACIQQSAVMYFFRKLSEMGLAVELVSNDFDAEYARRRQHAEL